MNNTCNSRVKFSNTQKRFLKSFKLSLGNISKAAKTAGIGRRTYYNWLKINPHFKAAIEDVWEQLFDIVEDALLKLIKAGNEKAIFFFLERKGKNRGYGR